MSHVTHIDKNIEEKVNYFIDYFNFVNNRIQDLHLFDIETHLSLIEKIIFQIENNTKNEKNRNRIYVYNHLDNANFQWKLFRNAYPELINIENLFNEKRYSKDKDWSEWVFKGKSHLLQALDLFKKKLDETYYGFIIKELEGKLACKHKLKTHQEDIHILTSLLVSEFRFKNIGVDKSKKIIESFTKNEIKFKEIISPKIKTRFFITKIHDLRSRQLINLKLEDVNFVSIKDNRFKRLFEKENPKFYFEEYTSDLESVVAIQKIDYYDSDTATDIFINNVIEKLDFLNYTYEYFLSVNPAKILITPDFDSFSYCWRSKYSPIQYINNKEKESINYYAGNILEQSKSKAKYAFLEFESTFQSAIKLNSITLYWQYLESLFWTGENKKKEIQDKMSSILLLNHKKILNDKLYVKLINELARNYPDNGNEYLEIYEVRDRYGNSNVRKLRPYVRTKFENYIYRQLLNDTIDYNSVKQYYNSIFIEAFEIRNNLVHSGKVCEKSTIKLKVYLSVLISRFRKLVISEINKPENDNFYLNEIIDLLLIEANKKFKISSKS